MIIISGVLKKRNEQAYEFERERENGFEDEGFLFLFWVQPGV